MTQRKSRIWNADTDAGLLLRKGQGWSGKELAEWLGCSEATVSERLRALGVRKSTVRPAGVRTNSTWSEPKPPTCKFGAAATAYCAALDVLAKAPPEKRDEALRAVRKRLDRMIDRWREFAATQEAVP